MTDYNTLQRKRNMIVGGFVIIAFCAFLWMIFIFGELPVTVSRFRSFNVLVKFPNAPGVQKSTPVQYCGYQIGKVVHVMSPERLVDDVTGQVYHQVKVTLAIEKKYSNIPSTAEVKVMKRSMGSSYIELQVDPSKPMTVLDPERPESMFLSEGMVLQGSSGSSSEFFPAEVQQKMEKLVDSISTLADNINDIVGDDGNKTNIKKTLENVSVMTDQATKTLKSFEKFSDTSKQAVEDVSEQLNDALVEFNELIDKINNGDSTAAKLINDGQLYENLLDSSEELELALEQLKMLAADVSERGIKVKL